MTTPTITNAQVSLNTLEEQMSFFSNEEQLEIEGLRIILRELIQKYGASAKLAMIATSLEVSISEGQ